MISTGFALEPVFYWRNLITSLVDSRKIEREKDGRRKTRRSAQVSKR